MSVVVAPRGVLNAGELGSGGPPGQHAAVLLWAALNSAVIPKAEPARNVELPCPLAGRREVGRQGRALAGSASVFAHFSDHPVQVDVKALRPVYVGRLCAAREDRVQCRHRCMGSLVYHCADQLIVSIDVHEASEPSHRQAGVGLDVFIEEEQNVASVQGLPSLREAPEHAGDISSEEEKGAELRDARWVQYAP
eukprot:CAMPEP_0177438966 /NCGR_PEP_ID=MMETSP0369-20130122/3052_1 /TAXON_ID=447022 ORGANISM="Scrippsiella hangoei-like, Strain SHHI-4" /NCGR_SAMPLE_ID=MMETSP0369 /ASSEMBLY_ACC=CAM_ASM_000364 /LENGTH=193 /DNA_ID=CAMNT_0018910599 /DNA_START=253 /DNA_END=833 /DNA_ORIENTATION=+